MTKSAHFLPGKATYIVDNWPQLYVKEIVRLHGVPVDGVNITHAEAIWILGTFRTSIIVNILPV